MLKVRSQDLAIDYLTEVSTFPYFLSSLIRRHLMPNVDIYSLEGYSRKPKTREKRKVAAY